VNQYLMKAGPSIVINFASIISGYPELNSEVLLHLVI